MHLDPKPDIAKEELNRRLTSYYPEFENQKYTINQVHFPEASSYPIYEFHAVDRLSRIDKRIIVKFAPVYTHINEGLVEFKNLTHLYNRLESANLAMHVPRPLDFLESINALVTEKVEGVRLNKLILKDNSIFKRRTHKLNLLDLLTSCGRWIEFHHHATDQPEEADLRTTLYPELQDKMNSLSTFGFPKPVIDLVEHKVSEIINSAHFPRLQSVNQHGDYGPQNIVVRDRHIYVFDLQREHKEVIYNDIAYFLVTLATMNLKHSYLTYDYNNAKRFEDAFLNGYFGCEYRDLDVQNRLLLKLYYLKNVIYRCEKQRTNLSKKYRGGVLRAYDMIRTKRYYPNFVLDLIEQLQDAWREYEKRL